ncbi:MAG: hypothetical protein RR751_02245 [Clostridia bacterium]
MKKIKNLVARNLSLFLENKMNILLSLASIPVILSIYIFFLRNFMFNIVGQMLETTDVKLFTDRIMFAGLLVVINTTTCFGIIQICINDRETGIIRDFNIAPIAKFEISAAYLISSIIVSFTFTIFTYICEEIFFKAWYSDVLPLFCSIKVALCIFISSCINSLIIYCITKKMKSTTTFSTFANLYGILMGFLAGTYLPHYFYPEALKKILIYFPPAEVVSIMRKILVGNIAENIEKNENALYMLGINLKRNGAYLTISNQLSIVIFSAICMVIYIFFSNVHEK